MNKEILTNFLLKARTKTYAAGIGRVESALSGSKQLEYCDGELLYRDVYYIGNNIFPGIETIYYQSKPVWSMSYFGDFKKLTEEESDRILRGALMEKWETTRMGNRVEWSDTEYEYICNGSGSIDELKGEETITKNGEVVYFFYYAGGFIG